MKQFQCREDVVNDVIKIGQERAARQSYHHDKHLGRLRRNFKRAEPYAYGVDEVIDILDNHVPNILMAGLLCDIIQAALSVTLEQGIGRS